VEGGDCYEEGSRREGKRKRLKNYGGNYLKGIQKKDIEEENKEFLKTIKEHEAKREKNKNHK